MKSKKTDTKNIFGKKLEQMLLTTNVKNLTIAKALNYDVSYISKWITGKAVPSRKNLEKVLVTVSKVIVAQGSSEGLEALYKSFGVRDGETLGNAIKNTLKDAYFEASGDVNDSKYINNASLKITPRGQYPFLAEYAATMNTDQPLNIAVMVDLFSLDHVSKLRMAGIENHRFGFKEPRRDCKIEYILDITKLDGNSIYDVILLIHMMTCYSLADFDLYYSDMAAGRLVISIKNEFAGISLLGNNRQFLCTTSTKDKKSVEGVYESIRNSIDPDKNLFFSTDMESLLMSHEYLQTLLSQDVRWLVGHMTEHFVPLELFDIFSRECFGDNDELAKEARSAHMLAVKAIEKNQVKIMLYNRAFVDFVLSGELDFFNNKLTLSPEQRKKTLIHIRRLFEEIGDQKIKLINDGFSDDFKYITNPCMFLSHSLDYLRLENRQYKDNLMLIKNETTRNIFNVFFEKIWNYDQNVVSSDIDGIVNRLDNLIETSELLAGVKKDIE